MPSNARGMASGIEQVKSFRAIRYEMCIQVGVACPIKGATAWEMAAGRRGHPGIAPGSNRTKCNCKTLQKAVQPNGQITLCSANSDSDGVCPNSQCVVNGPSHLCTSLTTGEL